MSRKVKIREEVPVRCAHDEMVRLSELKPHPRNRNKHPQAQIERLAQILKYQGFRMPVRVSRLSGFVTGGHGRIEAARLNGWERVPVNFQEYESEEQEYADLVADNAIALWAELDLKGIGEDVLPFGPDFDLNLLGLEDFTLDPSEKYDGDPDAVPEPPKEAKSKKGELWSLGKHRLLCGDATSQVDVDRLMAGDRADMVFTDPPYGVNYDGGHATEKRREKLANDESTEIYTDSVPMMHQFSKPEAALYLWFAATKSLQVLQVLQANGYSIRSWLIWNKNQAQFGAIGAQYKQKHEPCLYAFKDGKAPYWNGPNNEVSVWDVKRERINEFHPTQKPIELCQRAMKNSSPPNGIVLDLFGGSGSTLIACEVSGRRARLTELEPRYVDVILSRWANLTGKDPVREDGVKWSKLNG